MVDAEQSVTVRRRYRLPALFNDMTPALDSIVKRSLPEHMKKNLIVAQHSVAEMSNETTRYLFLATQKKMNST